MVDLLTDEQEKEVERIMNLAWLWLDSWDVVGNGDEKRTPDDRVVARLKLKAAISGLVVKNYAA